MKPMNVPGFTAEASLSPMTLRQDTAGDPWGDRQPSVVVPQIPGPNAPGLAGCLSDCRDEHPTWTTAMCRRICRDPGGTPGSGGGRKRDFGADAVCWTGYALCTATGSDLRPDLWASCFFGGPCTCEEVRDQCLSH